MVFDAVNVSIRRKDLLVLIRIMNSRKSNGDSRVRKRILLLQETFRRQRHHQTDDGVDTETSLAAIKFSSSPSSLHQTFVNSLCV